MRLAPLFAVTGLLALAPEARADLFAPRVEFPAGQDPVFLATGDFNHDGDRDIVTANTGASGSGVLLGGQGLSFGAFTPLGVGSANAVTVGDFNGDGDQDLAYAGPNGVRIVARSDDGTFATPVQQFVTSTQTAIAAVDFNRDGDPDLVSIDSDFAAAWPMFGAAGTSFSTTGIGYGVHAFPRAVAVADFDQNGTQELALTSHVSDGVVSVQQVGTGGDVAEVATLPHGGGGPESIAVGDFNGDGDPDLAITNLTGDSVSVRLGGAGFAFGDQTRYDVFAVANPEANGVATADFDGDGNLDLAVTGAHTVGVQVYLGRGDGTFTWNGAFGMGTPEPQEVVVDDFNADGRPDLAGVSKGPDTVSVLLNAALPAIQTDPAPDFGTQPQATIGPPRSVTVRSTGERALRVQRLRLTGPARDDFLVTTDTCTGEVVAPGDSCEVFLRFAPQAGGSRAASLQIDSDAGNAPIVDVALNGVGGDLPTGPVGPPGPSGAARQLLATVFAADRHSARAGRRLRVRYVSTMDALVTVQLKRGRRVVRRLTATAVAGRNTLSLRVPTRRGRYTLGLTAVGGDQRVTDTARLTVIRRRA
jgi:VCBS repeat protein